MQCWGIQGMQLCLLCGRLDEERLAERASQHSALPGGAQHKAIRAARRMSSVVMQERNRISTCCWLLPSRRTMRLERTVYRPGPVGFVCTGEGRGKWLH